MGIMCYKCTTSKRNGMLALINFSDTLIFISSFRNVFFTPVISSLFDKPNQNPLTKWYEPRALTWDFTDFTSAP